MEIMTLEKIREELIKIQKKYYTPSSKIARDIKVDNAVICKLINNKLDFNPSLTVILRLQKWIEDRKVD
ncbi:hypothetical protein [Clostridium sp.]|uniref:hypothetical protein n=1 Tax=Clostridium sp. TaxID=1506 RepID=UPI0029027230|nr:hypothetical protein [Clostridium sp.]MDU1968871.1 hypothetical protein [Clostridium perfringens]MDU1822377.1 hypothetical protein [Clostridium sp.]MDU1841543.1 hypothetical protein [Clostridium sp.]MDU2689645.1 hypothetical protein [Clostridium sp.]MDU2955828.1 hypothetical protein [Clostridium sp.]